MALRSHCRIDRRRSSIATWTLVGGAHFALPWALRADGDDDAESRGVIRVPCGRWYPLVHTLTVQGRRKGHRKQIGRMCGVVCAGASDRSQPPPLWSRNNVNPRGTQRDSRTRISSYQARWSFSPFWRVTLQPFRGALGRFVDQRCVPPKTSLSPKVGKAPPYLMPAGLTELRGSSSALSMPCDDDGDSLASQMLQAMVKGGLPSAVSADPSIVGQRVKTTSRQSSSSHKCRPAHGGVTLTVTTIDLQNTERRTRWTRHGCAIRYWTGAVSF